MTFKTLSIIFLLLSSFGMGWTIGKYIDRLTLGGRDDDPE